MIMGQMSTKASSNATLQTLFPKITTLLQTMEPINLLKIKRQTPTLVMSSLIQI